MSFKLQQFLLCLASLGTCLAFINPTLLNEGHLIAVLGDGDVTDLGYNSNVNSGRVDMERKLNLSGSLFAPDIADQASALAYIQTLVASGYKLIVSSTVSHGNAAAISAAKYPNVSFVQSGGTSTLDNLSCMNWVGPDPFYVAGIFCGAMTTNNRVGFIHPGPPVLGTLNAFYIGAKSVNPNVTVYTMLTSSFADADRTTGVADILINQIGVDMLAGHQNDFTLQRKAMAAGMLAVGLTGYSARQIFGEMIGFSVLRDWSIPLSQYAIGALQAPFRDDITGDFASNMTFLDIPSFLVPTDVWEKVKHGVDLLAVPNSNKPFYCGPMVSEVGPLNSTTGCLIDNSKYSKVILKAIVNLGTYRVPLVDVPFPMSTSLVITIVAAALIIATFAISVALYWLRKDRVMLAASPLFLGFLLLGCAFVFSAAIAWVITPTANACAARIWMPSIGFTLAMGVLIIKNVRLYIIFDAQFREVTIRDSKLLVWTGLLLAADILLLALWMGLGNPFVNIQQAIDGLSEYQTRKICMTNAIGDRMLYAVLTSHALLLAVGCFVTFKMRIIHIEELNEIRPFGMCIYIVSLVYIIAAILVSTAGTTNVQIIIIVSLSLLISAAAVLFILFIPKFLAIFIKGNRPIDRIAKALKTQSKNSHSSGDTGVEVTPVPTPEFGSGARTGSGSSGDGVELEPVTVTSTSSSNSDKYINIT